MMRDKQNSSDDRGSYAGARSSKDDSWSGRGGRGSDLGRESYTFERGSPDEPLSCTRIGAARDHIDAPTERTLRQGKAKTDDFMVFRQCVFAFRAGLCMSL